MKDETTCLRLEVNEALINKERTIISKLDEVFSKEAKLYSLLGSEVRLKIVYLLLKYEKMCVCDISDILKMKQSPVSQHLRKLKDANILISKREGLLINYYIAKEYKEELQNIGNVFNIN
ncbi:metalloregulator ArsR/SmtB family transcription factor [Halarcobacter sp.]|uniref:ArsR/SmtB family transcription factor n=1 Tax=Halarcobacter sp. TaxID=2321133 RepID=UPI002AA87B3A|nr:metalloregulator ArsR/SmtB family transcription factor [Halarcobacter sp.]